MIYLVDITYKDRFYIEASSKNAIRESIRKNWQKFGCQFEHMSINGTDPDEKLELRVTEKGELEEA